MVVLKNPKNITIPVTQNNEYKDVYLGLDLPSTYGYVIFPYKY